MLQRLWQADLTLAAASPRRRPAPTPLVRVGLVCPYTWDVPGGVQAHVRDLAETLLGLGHHVSVLTPAEDDDELPAYCVSAGRAGADPLQRLGRPACCSARCRPARTRRWLRARAASTCCTSTSRQRRACRWSPAMAEIPVVGDLPHQSTTRSRAMSAFEPFFIPALEKVRGRIAVSARPRAG